MSLGLSASWHTFTLCTATDIDVQCELQMFWHVSWLALRVIRHLERVVPLNEHARCADVFLGLAIYTNIRESWTTQATFDEATSLLHIHQKTAKSPAVMIEHVLAGTVRPLFALSKTAAVTAQGRRAIAPQRQRCEAIGSEKALKPWKFEQRYLLSVVRWVLQNLDVRRTSSFLCTSSNRLSPRS